MKKRHVCHHCGEHYPAGRLNCPHCGADRDFTHAEEPPELAVPDAMDDAAYEDFLGAEGLGGRRPGCLLAIVPILWILL